MQACPPRVCTPRDAALDFFFVFWEFAVLFFSEAMGDESRFW
jgi:hypothetical protein